MLCSLLRRPLMDSKRLTAEEVAERTTVGWLQAELAAKDAEIARLREALGDMLLVVEGLEGQQAMPDDSHADRVRRAAKALGEDRS